MSEDLAYIVEALRPLATPIDALVEDPANANTHDERSIRAIMASLTRYGQRTPLVVNRAGSVVAKDNGTLAAARRLGWSHIAALFVDDDPVTSAAAQQQTHAGYAIADNRAAQLAQFDHAALKRLLEQVRAVEPGAPAADMWTEVEWDRLFADTGAEADGDAEDPDDVEFPEYDEDVALVTCPRCGHEFLP